MAPRGAVDYRQPWLAPLLCGCGQAGAVLITPRSAAWSRGLFLLWVRLLERGNGEFSLVHECFVQARMVFSGALASLQPMLSTG